MTNWFAAMAMAMTGAGTVPRALPQDGASASRPVEALSQDLESMSGPDASVKAHTVRLVWTSDHTDAARRLQDLVEQPARKVVHPNPVNLSLPSWPRPVGPTTLRPASRAKWPQGQGEPAQR